MTQSPFYGIMAFLLYFVLFTKAEQFSNYFICIRYIINVISEEMMDKAMNCRNTLGHSLMLFVITSLLAGQAFTAHSDVARATLNRNSIPRL
jgi:hypothetical protein